MPLWAMLAIVVVISLLLGSCVWSFVGLFGKNTVAQTASDDFLRQVTDGDGFPGADDPVFSVIGDRKWEQKSIDMINLYFDRMGDIKSTDASVCQTVSKASTNEDSGTFSTCTALHRLDGFEGTSTMVWRAVGDGLTLDSYNIQLNDADVNTRIQGDIALIQRGLDPDNLPVATPPTVEGESLPPAE